MAGQAVKHDYHLVDPSPWPAVGSLSVFILALGFVIYVKGLFGLPAGTPWGLVLGFVGVAYTMIGWWGDVVKESHGGDHTPVVELGLRYGVILFIASEVMFFVAWFWIFFEMALFHEVRAFEGWIAQFADPAVNSAWASWPPPSSGFDAEPVKTFDPFHLPFLNTLILLTSGTTVTWAHHALLHGRRGEAKMGLFLTVLLGLSFTALQFIEYQHAEFAFSGNLYGASFFMATGFHGAHVIIGTIFLAVCLLRLLMGHFTPQKHFGFEAAAWYWHFVDVVWLFLFIFVYVIYG